MRIARSTIWCLTLAATLCLWLLLPPLRTLLGALLVLHGLILVWGVADLRSQFFVRALCRGPRGSRRIALTFDDGPDPALTPEVLDTLRRCGMKATFFVVGRRAERYPDLVKRAAAEGHTIVCHDLHHGVWSNFRLAGSLTRDIGEAREIIRRIIGAAPLLYRPPVGLTNPHTGIALARLGMQCIGWSRSVGDRGNRIAGRLKRIPSLAGPGEVVMLHDVLPRPGLKAEVLAQIDALCASVQEQGLTAVGVAELFGVAAYDRPA
jgi:peptidoglycan/xylan/chitin deacetylase (PgdA/CDA1 family)